MKKDFLADTIREYIIDNDAFTVPSRTLAKRLLIEYPDIFGKYDDKSISRVRGQVRRLRGAAGEGRVNTKNKLFEEKFGGYLEPKLNDYEDFIIPDDVIKLAILNDIHIPYQNQANLDAALTFLKRKNIDAILLNGDILDCYKVSYFLKDPRYRDMIDEFNILREFLDTLHSEFDCNIYYKLGNHEERIETLALKQIPELVHFLTFEDCLKDRGNFDLDEYNITIIKDKRRIKFTDNLTIIHGHEYRTGMFNPVGIARWLFNRAKSNAACGHGHKSDSFAARSLEGKTIATFAIGCLCDMTPKYMPLNDWQSGFAYVVRDKDNFKFTNLMIENGRVL